MSITVFYHPYRRFHKTASNFLYALKIWRYSGICCTQLLYFSHLFNIFTLKNNNLPEKVLSFVVLNNGYPKLEIVFHNCWKIKKIYCAAASICCRHVLFYFFLIVSSLVVDYGLCGQPIENCFAFVYNRGRYCPVYHTPVVR